jgi:hypothetical protein
MYNLFNYRLLLSLKKKYYYFHLQLKYITAIYYIVISKKY